MTKTEDRKPNTKLTKDKVNYLVTKFLKTGDISALENLYSSSQELFDTFEMNEDKVLIFPRADEQELEVLLDAIRQLDKKADKSSSATSMLSLIQILEFFNVSEKYLDEVLIPFANRDGWLEEIYTQAKRKEVNLKDNEEIKEYNLNILLALQFMLAVSTQILSAEFVMKNEKYLMLKAIATNPLADPDVVSYINLLKATGRPIRDYEDICLISDIEETSK